MSAREGATRARAEEIKAALEAADVDLGDLPTRLAMLRVAAEMYLGACPQAPVPQALADLKAQLRYVTREDDPGVTQ